MSPNEAQAAVLLCLGEIAPEVDAARLDPSRDLRDELDLDSMDFLNFLVAVHQRTGVDIPEADYGKLATLDQLVAYLARKLALP